MPDLGVLAPDFDTQMAASGFRKLPVIAVSGRKSKKLGKMEDYRMELPFWDKPVDGFGRKLSPSMS